MVGLIFLTSCVAEVAALFTAGEGAFRVMLSTVDAFEVASQDTWLGKDLTALRTLVVPQWFFAGWSTCFNSIRFHGGHFISL